MYWKRALAAATAGAATLIWMTIPAASAATGGPGDWTGAATATAFHNCNLTGSLNIYGCAMTHGSLKAVTLVSPSTPSLTNFFYNSHGQFVQAGTNLCLEYNAGSSSDPVRMDTCNSSHPSQVWISGDKTPYQLRNSYASTFLGQDECLEGSEEGGFGNPLTIGPCADQFNGENWIPAS
jgi:hypothetical protein